MVVLGGATEGEAEIPPVSAKAAGRKVPNSSKVDAPIREEIVKNLCLALKRTPLCSSGPTLFIDGEVEFHEHEPQIQSQYFRTLAGLLDILH